MRVFAIACLLVAFALAPASAQENFESWPKLQSTFPSTGGGGFVIKGYDPVIVGGKCVTTFMAVSGDGKEVYADGTLCTNGKWRAFEGGTSGTTPFRFFFKDGIFRAGPQ
jgi:hypothetical protein